MKARVFAWVFFAAVTGLPAAEQGASNDTSALMERLMGGTEFWDLAPDAFMNAYQALGFRWTSAAKESARTDGRTSKLAAFGKRVGETIVVFEEGRPKQLQVSLYNRGDDGEVIEDEFEKLTEFWSGKLTQELGVAGQKRPKENKSAVRTDGIMWTKEASAYLLESSAVRRPFRAEFIRLRVAKIVKKGFMEERLAKEERTVRADLLGNVQKKDASVFIQGVPMVDQGQKGYCVVATAARIFGYYGMQVDQHEMAQIAGSSASEGTNSRSMLEALHQVAGRFKVRVKVHYELDYKALRDMTQDYNREAKRAGKREFPDDPYAVNLWDNFDQFDPGVLKEARLKDKSGYKRFKSEVQNSIDIGVPLLWTLQVGIYREPKLSVQSRGGHMRLIIGYDWGKDELIYSDSWGAGHEFKRWGAEEAFCSTTGVYSVLPIK